MKTTTDIITTTGNIITTDYTGGPFKQWENLDEMRLLRVRHGEMRYLRRSKCYYSAFSILLCKKTQALILLAAARTRSSFQGAPKAPSALPGSFQSCASASTVAEAGRLKQAEATMMYSVSSYTAVALIIQISLNQPKLRSRLLYPLLF